LGAQQELIFSNPSDDAARLRRFLCVMARFLQNCSAKMFFEQLNICDVAELRRVNRCRDGEGAMR
jgi:hypothetical protein